MFVDVVGKINDELVTAICVVIFWVFMALQPANAHTVNPMDFSHGHIETNPALSIAPMMPVRGGVAHPSTRAASPRSFLHGVFISRPRNDQVYVAYRSSRSTKLIWYTLPCEPTGPYVRVEANEVPRSVRHQAYKWLAKT